MKKTNFLVIFWLLISLISFITFLIYFAQIWDSLSYTLIPSTDSYYTKDDILRSLIKSIPMCLLTATSFFLCLKQGLKLYNSPH